MYDSVVVFVQCILLCCGLVLQPSGPANVFGRGVQLTAQAGQAEETEAPYPCIPVPPYVSALLHCAPVGKTTRFVY